MQPAAQSRSSSPVLYAGRRAWSSAGLNDSQCPGPLPVTRVIEKHRDASAAKCVIAECIRQSRRVATLLHDAQHVTPRDCTAGQPVGFIERLE